MITHLSMLPLLSNWVVSKFSMLICFSIISQEKLLHSSSKWWAVGKWHIILGQNSLISIPYPRLNCLKANILPFTAAHTHVAMGSPPPHPSHNSDKIHNSQRKVARRDEDQTIEKGRVIGKDYGEQMADLFLVCWTSLSHCVFPDLIVWVNLISYVIMRKRLHRFLT